MKLKIFFIVFYIFSANFCIAQRFVTDVLRQSAEVLGLHNLKELPSGYSVVENKGINLSIIKTRDRIDHIGRVLFPKTLREESKLPIYDFLEFAWLEQSVLKTDNPFKYNDVFFNVGNWSDLSKVNKETPCSISINDGKNYIVIWSLSDNRQINITFPVEYENIISTATRNEIENKFVEDLANYCPQETRTFFINKENLKKINDSIFIAEGDKYLLPDINSNTYYYNNDRDELQLICDSCFVKESLSNIFCSKAFADTTIYTHLLFNLHESKYDTLSVPMPIFTNYLRSEDCILYWGLEVEHQDFVLGTVIASNSAGGYNHVFKVKCKPHDLTHISMTANLFVPTTNIRDLHKQYKPKTEKEKVKWQ